LDYTHQFSRITRSRRPPYLALCSTGRLLLGARLIYIDPQIGHCITQIVLAKPPPMSWSIFPWIFKLILDDCRSYSTSIGDIRSFINQVELLCMYVLSR
jgi:hypothetical protein